MYRAFSYTGFRIGLYPTVRNAIVDSGTFGDADSVSCRIAAGATTGAVGSAIFNPIDVVRIRMQGANPYPSTLGAFRAIAAEEGALGLWRGIDVCVARAALLSGSQLATYDTTKRWMKDHGVMSEGPALHFTASNASFVYHAAARVLAVAPGAGPTHGGTNVSLTGRGLLQGSTCSFGGRAALRAVWVSQFEVVCVTPPRPIGLHAVRLTSSSALETDERSAATFEYLPPLEPVHIEPLLG